MALTLYKSGQGYWTRMLTAVGVGTIVLAGLAWVIPYFDNINNEVTRWSVKTAVILVVLGVIGGLSWWVLNKPRVVDFLIATEAEMRKVNWPSRPEVFGSTWIVICGTAMMTLFLWVINLGFGYLFQKVILQ